MERSNLLNEVNALIKQAVALQQLANQVDQTDTVNLLNLAESTKRQIQRNTQFNNEIFDCLKSVVHIAAPGHFQSKKSDNDILIDLSGLNSQFYPQLIESVCDQLLEAADKKIDELNAQPGHLIASIVTQEPSERKMLTNNNILKPQNAWIHMVDNSYN